MSATAAILIRPVTRFSFSHPKFPNHTNLSSSSAKSVHWNCRTQRRPNPRLYGVVLARMDSDDDDFRLSSLEQEALVGRSQVLASSGIQPTLNKLSKWFFAVVFGVILLLRHDAQAVWASIGSILNSALSHVLKRILNQERPFATSRSDPGMPSSHAQSIFYIVTFAIVSIVQYFGLSGLTATLSGLIFALGCYFTWLRVSQKYHTINQVLVGATIGLGFAAFWFWVWDAIIFEAFTSFLWVRIFIILAAAGLCSAFFIYVIRYWVLVEHEQ